MAVRRRFYLLLACGLAVVALFLWLRPAPEPVYQGRCLSDWIVAMHRGKAPQREQARAAVHYLGPSSLPWLLKWLQEPDHPTLKARLSRAQAGAASWLERRKLLPTRLRPVVMDWKESYRFLAVEAFRELGPDGQAAIPELIRLLGDREGSSTNDVGDTAGFAYVVLRQMVPTSIPALIEALSSPDDQVWALAAEALGDAGAEARAAIPLLRKRLTDRDPALRLEAADAMGKLGVDPREFMPVVVEDLRQPDLGNLDAKLEVLLRYKEQAQSAVPVLRKLLADSATSTNWTTRYMLTNALAQLCPEALPSQESR